MLDDRLLGDARRAFVRDWVSPPDNRPLSGASGYRCVNPIQIETPEGALFPGRCGKCPGCIAFIKNDKAGRCAAEAMTSKDILLVTLTNADYKPCPECAGRRYCEHPKETREINPGAKEYVVDDWVKFIDRLRKRILRGGTAKLSKRKWGAKRAEGTARLRPKHYSKHTSGVKVRYMRVSEKGKKATKRRHWHAVLFFDKPVNLKVGANQTSRIYWPEWKLGHVNVQRVPMGQPAEVERASMYVAKYVAKGKGDDECYIGQSQNPALGTAWVTQEARRVAQSGPSHPLQPFFTVPFMLNRKRELRRFYLDGAIQKSALRAWVAEWLSLYGNRENIARPATPWLLRTDRGEIEELDDGGAIAPYMRRPRQGPGLNVSSLTNPAPVPPMPAYRVLSRKKNFDKDALMGVVFQPAADAPPRKGLNGRIDVRAPNGAAAGRIYLRRSGVAYYFATKSDEPTRIEKTTRGVLALSEVEHDRIESLLRTIRGDDWVDPAEYWRRRREGALRWVNVSREQVAREFTMPPSRLALALAREMDADTYADGVKKMRLMRRRRREVEVDHNWINRRDKAGCLVVDGVLCDPDGVVLWEPDRETLRSARLRWEAEHRAELGQGIKRLEPVKPWSAMRDELRAEGCYIDDAMPGAAGVQANIPVRVKPKPVPKVAKHWPRHRFVSVADQVAAERLAEEKREKAAERRLKAEERLTRAAQRRARLGSSL